MEDHDFFSLPELERGATIDYVHALEAERNAAIKRAEAAETALAAEFVYAVELVNRYGVNQWRRGVKGQPSVEFTHWKAANE